MPTSDFSRLKDAVPRYDVCLRHQRGDFTHHHGVFATTSTVRVAGLQPLGMPLMLAHCTTHITRVSDGNRAAWVAARLAYCVLKLGRLQV